MNLKKWLHGHSLKLLAIRDTPEAIAGGVAIGLFFGFIPLFGLKTLSAIFFSWLTGSNIIAAVVAGTLHDVFLPFMPLIYRWEYDVGYWLLSDPHAWPHSIRRFHLSGHAWRSWTTFLSVGRPLLLGSTICAAPLALASFFVTKFIVARHHHKKDAEAEIDPP
jgi:uncharacterized protein (DUF2062 family)